MMGCAMQTVVAQASVVVNRASNGQTHDAQLMMDTTAVKATAKGRWRLMNVAKDWKS
jgi:hypothetical protein